MFFSGSSSNKKIELRFVALDWFLQSLHGYLLRVQQHNLTNSQECLQAHISILSLSVGVTHQSIAFFRLGVAGSLKKSQSHHHHVSIGQQTDID